MVALTSRGLNRFSGVRTQVVSSGAARCRQKFLRYFPEGFRDADYIDLEREYKWNAHLHWEEALNRSAMRSLIREREYRELGVRAVPCYSQTESDQFGEPSSSAFSHWTRRRHTAVHGCSCARLEELNGWNRNKLESVVDGRGGGGGHRHD